MLLREHCAKSCSATVRDVTLGTFPKTTPARWPGRVTAIVLIRAETNRSRELADKIAERSGVNEVFSVAGRYDLVAIVKVAKNEDLADVISDKMRHLEGIVATETMIAFRAYSRTELEAGFELGLD
jgi:DNA-binding Lrp family transcriptional regulator